MSSFSVIQIFSCTFSANVILNIDCEVERIVYASFKFKCILSVCLMLLVGFDSCAREKPGQTNVR